MPYAYPSIGLYPRWPWLINFTDLSDAVVKKFGDSYLIGMPDEQVNVIAPGGSILLTDSSILTVSPNDPTTPVGKLRIANNSASPINVSLKNYYYNVAKALADLANTKGVDEAQVNAVNPPHYMLVQWQIAYLQEQVCKDNVGLNDTVDPIMDKYRGKEKDYHSERVTWTGKINYETFNTAAMQQSFTRAAARTFDVMY
jgi:hypothetical protein